LTNVGDLKISIVLDIVKANTEGKQFKKILQEVDTASTKAGVSTVKLSDSVQNLGLRYQGLTSVMNILKSTFGDFINAYQQQEVAVSKLANGIKNVGEGLTSVNKLSEQATELQKITPFGDEEIINAQAMLTTFQKNSEEIAVLTPRLLDLAAAYMKSGESGMDLQSVAVMLGKVNEETVGALRRVGVAFTQEEEQKLKSLKGTEQAIFLSKILDNNFKGMAETVGKTTAGQMKMFSNQVGDLKEAFGKLLVDILIPIVSPLKDLVKYLNDAGPVAQRAALGVTAMAIAFAALGTSLGGLPYIIGSLVTLFYSLSASYEISESKLKQLNKETLIAQEVSDSMKVILDQLGISANNMADAYDKISEKIAFMSKAQLESAKIFVLAEKAKIQALMQTMKALELESLAKMDFVPPDRGASIEQRNVLGFSADLEKIEGLLSEIEAKMSAIGLTGDTGKSNTKSTSKGKVGKDEKEFVSYLQQLNNELAEVNKQISLQSANESEAEGLFVKRSDLELAIQYVDRIQELKKITAEVRGVSTLSDLADKVRGRRAGIALETPIEIFKKEDKANLDDVFSQGISFAQQFSSTLGFAADSFGAKFLGALQTGLSLANSFASLLSAIVGGTSSGGIFSILGLASGGQVPGSGTGDTVPAMLTPGEFVINRSRASQLGTGFLTWLNGGGLFPSVAGQFNSGGLVSGSSGDIIIQMNGALTDNLSYQIVQRGGVQRKIKMTKSKF